MIYETTTCWRRRQFRVKPMNRGVFSSICGSGGLFHSGILGRSDGELAVAARGKLSVMSGRGSGFGLYRGVGLGGGGFSGCSCFGTGNFSQRPVLKRKTLEANTKPRSRRKIVCRNLPWESNIR